MHITCPHCNATYEVGPVIKNALLVCYRCHTEFSVGETPVEAESEVASLTELDEMLPLFEHVETIRAEESETDEFSEKQPDEEPELVTLAEEAQEPEPEPEPEPESLVEEAAGHPEEPHAEDDFEEVSDATNDIELIEFEEEPAIEALPNEPIVDEPHLEPAAEEIEESSGELMVPSEEKVAEKESDKGPLPPARKRAAIWPWLMVILLIISGSGFWYKQDVWLDNPWVRSVLINMHLPVEVRNNDWLIIPESVHGQWLTKDDGSRILMIEGRVANRLYSELSPPQIQVHFYDDSGLDHILGAVTLRITEPPGIEQVKHAPFEMPDIDRVPMEAQGERGFFLVIESLPERTADFTLTAVVGKK